jgi:hypothetical protein
MARLDSNFKPNGPIQHLSFYKIRGSDETYVRTKGGPTSEQVKKSPRFVNTRRNNMEFGGRSSVSKLIMRSLRSMRLISDYSIAGSLNSLLKPLQTQDKEGDWGQRSVQLTKNPDLLRGFSLNKKLSLDSLITRPLEYRLSKDPVMGSVTFPELVPGINFNLPAQYPFYKIMVTVSILDDVFYNKDRNEYVPNDNSAGWWCEERETDWLPAYPATPAFSMMLDFTTHSHYQFYMNHFSSYTCMLTVGVAFGQLHQGALLQTKYVGAGKIIATA